MCACYTITITNANTHTNKTEFSHSFFLCQLCIGKYILHYFYHPNVSSVCTYVFACVHLGKRGERRTCRMAILKGNNLLMSGAFRADSVFPYRKSFGLVQRRWSSRWSLKYTRYLDWSAQNICQFCVSERDGIIPTSRVINQISRGDDSTTEQRSLIKSPFYPS